MSAFMRLLLCHRQQRRSFLVCGFGTQDAYLITLLNPPWLIHPSLLLVSASCGGRKSGEFRCLLSSVWRRESLSTNFSGKTQMIEQIWEEYFADPSQWWDNRVEKRNPKVPDFKHKVSRKALWADAWSTPPWVKAKLELVTQGKLESHVGYHTSDSEETSDSQSNRSLMDNVGRRNTLPTSTRRLRQIVQGGDFDMRIQGAKTTSDAIVILKNRLQQGIVIDSYMYVKVLKQCFKHKDLLAAKQVHDCIIESGMENNIFVANNLLSSYVRCGRLQDARGVFDELVKKDVISWNVMIGGYAQHNCAKDAMEVFKQMCQQGVQPDEITYLNILRACASPSALKWGKEVHAYIRLGGLESDVRVGTALLKMYAKCGSIKEARETFDKLVSRNVVSWNVMIGAYAESGCGEEAYRLLLQMKGEGFNPDAITYTSILNACASAGALEWVKEVHGHVLEAGLESDLRLGNALVHMYAKSGSVDDARLVFDRMGERDVRTWTVMIGGLAQHGCGHEAYELFLQMKREGFKPDAITLMSILNACSSAGSLEWVKEVHRHAREAGFESNVRVGNALVHMYAKSGSVDDARLVFDRMEERDVITWTAMIGGLAQHGFGRKGYELFLRMQQEGFTPNATTYVSMLNAAASVGALEWVKEVHSHAVKAGLDLDVRVGNALVHMYAKSGSIDDARNFFDRMGKRDIITWNVMIGAYAESGCGEEAYGLFLQVIREGIKPDPFTYVNILNPCASAGALEWVKDVHSHALKAGLESDVRVGNALVHMYAKSGRVDDARLVFDRMEERDAVSWNVMIGGLAQRGCGYEAYELFLRMKREGFKANICTYASILNACGSSEALEWVKELHSHAREAGFESDVRVGNALVNMYAKSGSIDDARRAFDQIEERDVRTWNAMIGGLAQRGFGREAYELFLRMQQEGFTPNVTTYMIMLNASASVWALEWVKEVHNHALKAGLESDVRVGNALVHMFAKSGSIDDARLVFDRMDERDVITWNMIIGAYSENGSGEEAYRLFLEMIQEGLKPDAITYLSILNACANTGALEWVKEVHSNAVEAGLESDVRVGNALVHMYAKCGSISDARLVFDRMDERDVITWNVIIGAYAESGCGEEAYGLFLEMIRKGFKPDSFTYVNILNPCASSGAVEWVKEVHSHAREAGFESDVRVGNALVHMHARSGNVDDARLVFDSMKECDLVTWNVMIGGLAQHGCGYEALEVFRKMNAAGMKPDGISFVAVLSACSHAGLVDEGRRLFLAMSQEYGIEPTVVHCTCMVDLLGRAGRLEEAKLFIDSMPVEPNGATWGALLGACRSYGNVELGELAAKERLKLEPKDPSTYVLLSNMYAAADKWQEVSLVRTMMQERGIRKGPGCSWIEVDNRIHSFVVGDRSHPDVKEIYAELSRLTEKIKAEGYLPDTRLVLHNIDEKDKEFALCSHSEKLAITYGLLHTPSSKPIRVYKNLRVCSDCHMATKFISKVTRKEIVVRDVHRFHHFKDGVCSCQDYW